MFDNILSLRSGYALLYDGISIKDQEYWDLVYPELTDVSDSKNEDYYAEALNDLIDESIRLRLRSDVPVGFYLSGGLDSTLIGCKAHEISNGNIKQSFSIIFKENDINEDKYQRIVANYLNLDHKSHLFLYSDISSRLPQAIYHSECALKETYNTASLALSESVKESNLKVVLTGEGADELFAGYVGYRFDVIRKINGLSEESNKPEEKYFRKKIWGDGDFFYEKNKHHFRKVKQSVFSKKISDKYEEFDCYNHFIVNSKRIVNRDVIHQRSYSDFKLRLVDHLVTDHGDKMALANSVEARYPFLDKDLVNFACTIPPTLKLNNFEEKYIVKKIAKGQIPEEIVTREKFGFVAPGSPYLLKRNIEYINDILSYDTIKKQGYFNADEVEKMKKEYMKEGFHINIPFDSDLLLIVLTHGIFLDQFQMPSL